jgi:hypothetical protein
LKKVNTMGKSFRFCPQLEALEDRLPPGDLRGGLSHIGRGGEVLPAAAYSQEDDRAGPGSSLVGGEVLSATAHPNGNTLTDMASETALFLTSGNDPSRYPNTPFQILYYNPATLTVIQVNGGLVAGAINQFTVKPGTPFYVPLATVDDSPPLIGTFPTTPQAAADYVFSHDQVGMRDLQIVVDGHATSIGAAYAAGPVHTPPLLDGGGSHIITVGAFLTPLSPGVHTVTISGVIGSGVAFQQATGLAFQQEVFTYTVTVQPH